MPNDDIIIDTYKEQIDAILNEIPVSKPKIEYVDSVYRRAREMGKRSVREDDIAFSIPRENLIVLQKRITQSKKKSILTGIDLVISFVDISPSMTSPSEQILNSDEKFVEHTIRHEVAHCRGIISEAEADVYAFEQMGKKVILRIRI